MSVQALTCGSRVTPSIPLHCCSTPQLPLLYRCSSSTFLARLSMIISIDRSSTLQSSISTEIPERAFAMTSSLSARGVDPGTRSSIISVTLFLVLSHCNIFSASVPIAVGPLLWYEASRYGKCTYSSVG